MAKFDRMTKKELLENLEHAAVEAEVFKLRCKTALEDVDRLTKKVSDLQTNLDKAESFVEQGRAMIEAIMERWYHYDT